MTKVITYYYSHVSPWSYLGHQRLADIATRHGATIDYVPVSVALIFPKTGGVPLPKRAPERQAYRMVELKRWHSLLGVPLNPEPKYFPADDRPAARMALTAKAQGENIAEFSQSVLRACWAEDRNVGDAATLIEIANAVGLDGQKLLNEAGSHQAEQRLEEACEQAMADGCFGMPWYVVDGQPFWGQDRLDLLEKVLAGEL